eukprot:gnl/Chilomastix_cuspidata/635.p1 GENE.gnl/Chilomastix_cuspidata/635~~gnl/Chilomastix_cuspidata/635.p1  ORF type:complete len:149 (+),score=8.62 gnl/Chilomastix_cuspidata/635:27-473(+)
MIRTSTETFPETTVLCVRHIGPYHEICTAFQRLGKIMEEQKINPAESKMIGLYHDDPKATPVAELRSDACCTVPPGFEAPEGATLSVIPAGAYFIAHFESKEPDYHALWAQCAKSLVESGHAFDERPSLEIYDNYEEGKLRICMAIQE